MKKMRLLAFVALVLCFGCLLSACGKKTTFGKLYSENLIYDDLPLLASGTLLEVSGSLIDGAEDLAVFYLFENNVRTYSVYNVKTNQVVHTWTLGENEQLEGDFGFLTVDEQSLFWYTKQTTADGVASYNTIIFDANGKEITNLPKTTAPTAVADMMMVEDRYYRWENDSFVLKFEHSALASDLPEFTAWSDTHYYAVSSTQLQVYDASGLMVASYVAPASAVMSVLSDGNVLVQYSHELPADAHTYDVYNDSDSSKQQLVSLIFDIKKGSTTEVELDYILSFVLSRGVQSKTANLQQYGFMMDDLFEQISEDVDNIGFIVPIEDKRINYTNMQSVSIDNKGSVKKQLNDTLPGQSIVFAIPVIENRYLVAMQTGEQILVDGEGNRLGDVTSVEDHNQNFLVAGGKVYDMDLKFVLDFGSDDYELKQVMDEALIFSKPDTVDPSKPIYYILRKNQTELTKLDQLTEYTDQYYIIRDDQNNYIYYNEAGTEFFRTTKDLVFVMAASDSSAILLEGQNEVYRLSK